MRSSISCARRVVKAASLISTAVRGSVGAGVKAWPKLFVNLRSSRETELMQAHPAHVVLAWIGHTAKVARSHYLQLTDSDFDRAAQTPAQIPAQIPAQSTLPNALPEPSGLHQSREKRLQPPKNANQKVPPAGIEQA